MVLVLDSVDSRVCCSENSPYHVNQIKPHQDRKSGEHQISPSWTGWKIQLKNFHMYITDGAAVHWRYQFMSHMMVTSSTTLDWPCGISCLLYSHYIQGKANNGMCSLFPHTESNKKRHESRYEYSKYQVILWLHPCMHKYHTLFHYKHESWTRTWPSDSVYKRCNSLLTSNVF